MALKLTEEHAMRLIQPHLRPGEQVLHKGHGIEQPWWTHLVRVGAFFWKYYVVAATTERLLLIRVGSAWNEKEFAAVEWSHVEQMELRRGLLMRPLVIEAPALGRRHKINLPRFSPLRNFDAAAGMVAVWRGARALPPPSPRRRTAAG